MAYGPEELSTFTVLNPDFHVRAHRQQPVDRQMENQVTSHDTEKVRLEYGEEKNL